VLMSQECAESAIQVESSPYHVSASTLFDYGRANKSFRHGDDRCFNHSNEGRAEFRASFKATESDNFVQKNRILRIGFAWGEVGQILS